MLRLIASITSTSRLSYTSSAPTRNASLRFVCVPHFPCAGAMLSRRLDAPIRGGAERCLATTCSSITTWTTRHTTHHQASGEDAGRWFGNGFEGLHVTAITPGMHAGRVTVVLAREIRPEMHEEMKAYFTPR